jgi:type 1 fimbria pilin
MSVKRLTLIFLAVAALSAVLVTAQGKQTFTGMITDSECPAGDHSAMQMGPDDASCTISCVENHGALYLLFHGDGSYNLSDQKAPKAFAGKKVTVTGTLDAKTNTIKVDSITAAK